MRSAGYEPLPQSSFELECLNAPEAEGSVQSCRHFRRSWSSKQWLHSLRQVKRRLVWVIITSLVFAITFTSVFSPSYNRLPAHYTGNNAHNEKVFVAACIVDADLIRGAWGRGVLELIDAIGAQNVFLSVYENDSGPETREALLELAEKVECNHSIISEHLPLENLPSVVLPSGQKRTKRIPYLAEVRNRAMRPFYSINLTFDKVLFLNDVVFAGKDAANLLFATGAGVTGGHTSYHAACAVDFINPIKFYDTFATRDLDGYSMGLPFFPWFSSAGSGKSRQDVLSGTDSVRVRSCWGGMAAFDARWFYMSRVLQRNGTILPGLAPLAFRGEEEMFWEASESCLIHADIQALAQVTNSSMSVNEHFGTGIFMNPFIRVAYSESVFRWLDISRRFERLYVVPHQFAAWLVGLPFYNPRRLDKPGDQVNHLVWTTKATVNSPSASQSGQAHEHCYRETTRKALPGGFCGGRKLLYLKQDREPGERMWTSYPIPPLDRICEG